MENNVWVFAEHTNGECIEPSLELICEGRRLADQLNKNLSVISSADMAPLSIDNICPCIEGLPCIAGSERIMYQPATFVDEQTIVSCRAVGILSYNSLPGACESRHVHPGHKREFLDR